MTSLLCFILSPVLFLISLPFAIFAAITTSLAFSTLFFRALVVYAELAVVLLQNQFFAGKIAPSDRQWSKPPSSANDEKVESRQLLKSRRSSAASTEASGGLGIYGRGIERDFEGVGGWKSDSDDDDVPWSSINSRLELPALVDERKRNHRRSLTSGSLATAASMIPRPVVRPMAKTPSSAHTAVGGDYFDNRPDSSRPSAAALDAANIGKALLRRKTSFAYTFS